jgi:hypothetical protein
MPDPQPDASMATCVLCQPPEVIGEGILDHLRLLHPGEYGDGPEQWPDRDPQSPPFRAEKLTTPQKELFADAVDAFHARANAEDPDLDAQPVDRWWKVA